MRPMPCFRVTVSTVDDYPDDLNTFYAQSVPFPVLTHQNINRTSFHKKLGDRFQLELELELELYLLTIKSLATKNSHFQTCREKKKKNPTQTNIQMNERKTSIYIKTINQW